MKNPPIPKMEQKIAVENDSVLRTTLSFYKYVKIQDPQEMRDELYEKLSDLGCLGRIYVAHEGINAQMNVPESNWDVFDEYIQSKTEFRGVPYKIAIEETEDTSFYRLIIKVKNKIVADGLDDDSFDVTNTGTYLTAKEMNDYIDDPNAVIVDMRNGYESEIGHFENAVTPDVDTFKEELKVTPETLKEYKNKKMAIYCTGGIRCEKASAWLKHNGFKDVRHLRGGIIDYKRQVEEEEIPNKFRGKNFVFDERLSESVSKDVIAHCHLCHTEKCDHHTHCKNVTCNVLFIGCKKCLEKKKGYCSYRCITFDKLPEKVKKAWARRINKNKPKQFKKNRLRGVVR